MAKRKAATSALLGAAAILGAALTTLVMPIRPAAAEEPVPDCSARAIARTRAAFQAAYDARDYAAASAIIAPLWEACVRDRPAAPALGAAIASDYAIAAHRTGDDELCLDLLLDYARPPGATVAGSARLPAALRRAIDHNIGLCRVRACASQMSAACASLRILEQSARLVGPEFRAAPCGFGVEGVTASVALPSAGGARAEARCLALLPPELAEVSLGEREGGDPARVCPRAVLARRGSTGEGRVRTEPVALPDHSFLRDTGLCCAEVELTVAPDGRVAATPVENPPEHCLSGHRTDVLQDVFALRGTKLVLQRHLGARSTPPAEAAAATGR